MPPKIAALLSILLILYLFWVDRKKNEGVSKAIWIPSIWMFISGSRFVSHWINLGRPVMSEGSSMEGSPLDRVVFMFLILAGIMILKRRKLNWNELLTKNTWIWLFFLFGVISIYWSDYPFVSFKRWIKSLGTVIMALVIITEERPSQAVGVILKRLAFVLLPLSILFIKYYPLLGRAYNWMGMPMFTGVAGQKNGLGAICLLSSIYFSWELLLNRRYCNESGQRLHYSIYIIIIPMIVWLLYKANSATSLACVVVVICLFLLSRLPAVTQKPHRILFIGIAFIFVFGTLELFFDVKDTVIVMLGRRPDLTTRVPMWKDLLTMAGNPIIGVGYESFWLGARQDMIKNLWGYSNQAHNGYLEVYLNLGVIGLFIVTAWILTGVIKVAHLLSIDYPVAILRLSFIVVAVLYNITEATLDGVSNIWLLLFLGIMEIGPPIQRKRETSPTYNLEQDGTDKHKWKGKKSWL